MKISIEKPIYAKSLVSCNLNNTLWCFPQKRSSANPNTTPPPHPPPNYIFGIKKKNCHILISKFIYMVATLGPRQYSTSKMVSLKFMLETFFLPIFSESLRSSEKQQIEGQRTHNCLLMQDIPPTKGHV